MENLLASLGPFGLLASFAGLIALFTIGLRFVTIHKPSTELQKSNNGTPLKKYEDVDIQRPNTQRKYCTQSSYCFSNYGVS